MNKILALFCGVGVVLVGAVVAYILIHQDAPVVKTPSPPAVPPTESAATNIDYRVVAGSFYNPCGVAVQPETGHIFISMVGRIVRVVPRDPSEVHDEVTGFPSDTYGRGPIYEFGPLGLAFADKSTLVVGDGSQEDGKEIVRIYAVGSQPPPADKVRKADDMTSFSTPITPGDDSLGGEGNFYGVAIHGPTVFVTSNGDDSKGWICKLELDMKKPPPLKLTPYIKSKELTDMDAPMGATISPDGKLVVSQFGPTNVYPKSLLTFYDPSTGNLERKLKTGLHNVIGVAYSPKTGKLYGLDFSWADPGQGGLFRLEVGADQVKAVRLAVLEKPTALAFAPDGKLYVTVLGSGNTKESKTGRLLVFDGL